MIERRSYELRVDGRGACEFRCTRPYGIGDHLCLPLAHDCHETRGGSPGYPWQVVDVAESARYDAVLVLAPVLPV